MHKLLFFYIAFLFAVSANAQPQKPTAVDIYNQIQKLNFLGSVLYIAAHPDDENTRLIAWLSNEQHARTGYLSLTRGDGGQNLIGPQLRELLGVIRTQELLEARKIDGGQQFFSRANDFGYSKTPDETLRIWEKDKVLADVVWAIRKFRPDVIINRFDARSPGTTHGHHTASAILSLEAFDKAADASSYPEQLQFVKTWKPKRAFFNTSWWFYGGKDKFDQADKSKLTNLEIGSYYESLGKSNQEIAALSRSRHQSQGFGSTGSRGEETEYLELVKGDATKNKNDLFEGIDTSWNRVAGGSEIGIVLNNAAKNFDFKNPAASVPELVKAYQMIQSLKDEHWKAIKSEEIKNIIAACSGLYLEAVAEKPETTPGTKIKIDLEAINRSAVPVTLSSYQILPGDLVPVKAGALKNNIDQKFTAEATLPADIAYTQPYWLKEAASVGMYRVANQQLIGMPDVVRQLKVIFNISIDGVAIPIVRDVVYKYNDDVKGEVYQPFDIIPKVTTSIADKVAIFNQKRTKTVTVKVKAGAENISGKVKLELPESWVVTPSEILFSLALKGEEQTVSFDVTAPKTSDEATAKAFAVVDGEQFGSERIDINYAHIPKQMVLKPSEAKFIKLDIRTGGEKIAYIMGVGDEVNKSLTQMGYDVTLLRPEEISSERLAAFDVVMTGIRAYNSVKTLALKQDILFDFVKSGKTMIVQYNTTGDLVTDNIAPFPLKLSRDRVTEETAEVRFIDPKNDLLNRPNKITADDFKGWTQEQGLYYPSEWDSAFTAVISSNDQGETPKNGALLVAKYGKGHYIYTGLSFFRELPAGVSGAFRLMANLISIGN